MSHSYLSRSIGLCIIAGAAVTLSACGSQSTESIHQVWPEVHQQLQDATSVRIQGELGVDGAQAQVEYAGQLDSSNFRTVLDTEDGTHMEAIGNAEMIYGQFPDPVLDGMDPEGSVKDMLDGRWLEQPTDSMDLSVELFLADGTANLPGEEWDGDDVEPEEVERFDRDLYRYEDSERGGAIYLDPEDFSLAGLEHPGHGSTAAIDLEFRDWNSVEEFAMPADDEIVTELELVGMITDRDTP